MAAAAAVVMLAISVAGRANAEEIVFWSNQAQPVEEAQRMREQVLAGFGKPVRYPPHDPGLYTLRIHAESLAGIGTISVIGGTHGDFASFADTLIDLSDFADKLKSATKINPRLLELGHLGTAEQKYIPWMQAGYVMVANRQALQYLPDGANLNTITFDQLRELGDGDARSLRWTKDRFAGGSQRALAPLLPRLSVSFLHSLSCNEISLA